MKNMVNTSDLLREYARNKFANFESSDILEFTFLNNIIQLDKLYDLVENSGGFENLNTTKISEISIKLGFPNETINTMGFVPAFLTFYNQNLTDFKKWLKSSEKSRKSSRHRKKSENNNISTYLYNLIETKIKNIGYNSIYSSLLSGIYNEIDTTLLVLLDHSNNPTHVQKLLEMSSLCHLIPSMVGVFPKTSLDRLEHLKNIPHIQNHYKYIIQHQTFSSQSSYSTDDSDNHLECDSIPFESRFKIILNILLNLFTHKLVIPPDSCILQLLNLCLNCDINDLCILSCKVLKKITKNLKITQDFKYIHILCNSLQYLLIHSNHAVIVEALNIIINLTTNLETTTSPHSFINFDLTVLFELLSLFDSIISHKTLLALQVIANFTVLHCPKPKLSTYLHSLVLLATDSALLPLCTDFHQIYFIESDLDHVTSWLSQNYQPQYDWSQCVTLYSIFHHFFETHPNSQHLCALHHIFHKYSTVLNTTFSSIIATNNETTINQFLSETVDFLVPFSATPPIYTMRSRKHWNSLKYLQIYRLMRKNDELDQSWVHANTARMFIKNDKLKHNTYIELDSKVEKMDEDISPEAPSLKSLALCVITNLCHCNPAIGRYVKELYLDELMEGHEFDENMLNLFKTIIQ